jgi:hypothetical protein
VAKLRATTNEVIEYKATQSEHAERYFTCKNCGAKGEVRFHAHGEGVATENAFVDDGAQRALAGAEEDLMLDADRVLHLIRCPTCGRRDGGYVMWTVIRPVLWFATAAALYTLEATYFAIPTVGLIIGGVWQAWREGSRYRRANRAQLLRLKPGSPPERKQLPAKPTPKPLPPPPDLPVAVAINVPPLAPIAPQPQRGPDEEPAFLKKG